MSIARHTSYNIAGKVLPLVAALATVPLYLHLIGLERYGILVICHALFGFMGFMGFGMGPAVAQRLALLKEAQPGERSQVFWTAFWLNAGLGLIAAAALYCVASLYFLLAADMSSPLQAETADSLLWLASITPLILLSGFMTGALMGRERFLAMNAITSFGQIGVLALPLLAAWLIGPELPKLIAAMLLANLLSVVLLYGACRKAVPLGSVERASRGTMRSLLAYGGWVTATALANPLLMTFDRFVIGATIGTTAVPLFSIPSNLLARMMVFPHSLASAAFPRMATEADGGIHLQRESTAILNVLVTPMSVLAAVAMGPFLALWLGEELGAQAEPIAYILLAGYWANSLAQIPYALLHATGRPDLITKLLLAYLIPYAILLFGGLWLFGLVGAAIASTIKLTCDPIALFIFTGERKILVRLAAPALLVFGSCLAALLTDWRDATHWLIMGALLTLTLVWSIWTMPSRLVDHLSRMKKAMASRMQGARS